MSATKRDLALHGLQEAVRLRKSLGYRLSDAISPYECADKLGLEVRFVDYPSLEGMYVKGSPPTILISSLRPSGRASYTCAHEIAHHVFNHGMCVDLDLAQSFDEKKDPDEFLAQVFAGFFLMPKIAVEQAFTSRGWRIATCSATQIYTVACWFGVGYTTLIDHMQYSLRILTADRADVLRRSTIKQIRTSLAGKDLMANLMVVDTNWTARAIDVQVGDVILLPEGTMQNGNKSIRLDDVDAQAEFYKACVPGIAQFYHPTSGWSAFLRVARQGFTGRSIFRFLDDPEFDEGKVADRK